MRRLQGFEKGLTLLESRPFFLTAVELPAGILEKVLARDWVAVDALVGTECRPGGAIFEALRAHEEFSSIEFILSIRSSIEEPDEDGIWHDDGSRALAFSLSLTLKPEELRGGRLGLRKSHDEQGPVEWVQTPPYGTMIVFATGQKGFEHRIHRVEAGERIIVAGWCS